MIERHHKKAIGEEGKVSVENRPLKLKALNPDHPKEERPNLSSPVSDLFFSNEKGQRAILTALVFATLIGLTWLFRNTNPTNLGIRTNIANILWFSSIYFFFQIFDRVLSFLHRRLKKLDSDETLFSLEFLKFFLALNTSFAYNATFLGGGFTKGLQAYGILNYLTTHSVMAAIAATIFYRFRLLKDLALKSRVAQAEAQYSMLESQMQPHFLFNSLNVLSELIYVDPDLANSMSQKLADLYREILQNSKNKFCTLESELSILTKYVEIQKIRFGDRVRFHMKVDKKYQGLLVPSLMLQTLVENAIKHGLSPKKDGGDIYFDIEPSGNLFEITISNTGELYKGHLKNKRSTGLQNTQNRLTLIYGNKHNFKIYSDEKKTFVRFKITGRNS